MSIQQYQTTKKGGPFSLVTVPKPTPGPKEVCIRPRAVALNGIDWKNLRFGATIQSWPAILGIDGAGTVESVGDSVTDFKVGDEVMSYAHGIHGKGAFQDVYTVSDIEVTKKPASLSYEEASSVPTVYLTALACIIVGLKVTVPGLSSTDSGTKLQSILILGGSSGVGSFGIQILRLALPSVHIVATSSAAHHAHLKSLGANTCLERAAQQDAAALRAATPGGAGFDAILDAVGAGPDSPAVFEALKTDGPKLYSLVITRPDAKVPDGLQSTLIGGPMALGAAPAAMAFLGKALEEGKFRLPLKVEVVGKGFQAVEANLDRFPANVSGVKLVVTL